MKFYENRKGQIIIAIITAIGAVGASIAMAWATSNNRVSEIDKQVSVIQEREANHYLELREKLEVIDKQFDGVNSKLDVLIKKK